MPMSEALLKQDTIGDTNLAYFTHFNIHSAMVA